MLSAHLMPFGARVLRNGSSGVEFRLWAPAARSVELLLEPMGSRARRPMNPLGDGWYETTVEGARPGLAYCYRIDDRFDVPDPASRSNPFGVHGPSVVVDPWSYVWGDAAWRGVPWPEAVIYELHVGTFTPLGTYRAAVEKLAYLVDLGITLIELMPIASFAGTRGWGYDGVLLFAPSANYGTPEDFKYLVDAAHAHGLGVLLDVVYNHFGPEGNYLFSYAPQFLTERHHTPWGNAINYDGPHSESVRAFFLHNAQYWLEEFHLDGLRLDSVHSILDDSPVHIVEQLARIVHTDPAGLPADGDRRHRHLVLENADNDRALLGAADTTDRADAQWHDDVHHALHVLLTGEVAGYYQAYTPHPVEKLSRALGGAFIRDTGEDRSLALAPATLVSFLQNHDQIGNRAFGERLAQLVPAKESLLAAAAIVLLAPLPVMLFMGEEWAAREPFIYFCDVEAALAERVREGRSREFGHFPQFSADRARTLPDPADVNTFHRCRLNWADLSHPPHAQFHEVYRRLLAIRKQCIVPLIPQIISCSSQVLRAEAVIRVIWRTTRSSLTLLCNLSSQAYGLAGEEQNAGGQLLYSSTSEDPGAAELPPWRVQWFLHTVE